MLRPLLLEPQLDVHGTRWHHASCGCTPDCPVLSVLFIPNPESLIGTAFAELPGLAAYVLGAYGCSQLPFLYFLIECEGLPSLPRLSHQKNPQTQEGCSDIGQLKGIAGFHCSCCRKGEKIVPGTRAMGCSYQMRLIFFDGVPQSKNDHSEFQKDLC